MLHYRKSLELIIHGQLLEFWKLLSWSCNYGIGTALPSIKFFIGFDSNRSRDKKRGNEQFGGTYGSMTYNFWICLLPSSKSLISNFSVSWLVSLIVIFFHISCSFSFFFFFFFLHSKILPLKTCNYNHITYLTVNFSVKN